MQGWEDVNREVAFKRCVSLHRKRNQVAADTVVIKRNEEVDGGKGEQKENVDKCCSYGCPPRRAYTVLCREQTLVVFLSPLLPTVAFDMVVTNKAPYRCALS